MDKLVALVRWLARPAQTRPIWRRHPRWTVNVASVIIGLVIVVAALVAGASPAHAVGCADPDQQLGAIAGTAHRGTGGYQPVDGGGALSTGPHRLRVDLHGR